MSSATITLIGLYNYLNTQDTDLFSGLTFPEGIDRATAINNILFMSDDKELLYPDADFMISAIGLWSTKWQRTFEKWIAVLSMTYNPIENYDRNEAWSDSASTSESSSTSASDSSSETSSMTNDVSAFNVSTYSPEESASGNTGTTASTQTQSLNNKLDYSLHGGRIHGNIGVMTTQDMIKQEIELGRFNIYDEIAIIFLREFTLAL